MTRKITTSYSIYEPDHDGEASEIGWENEEGVPFDTVLEAAVWLVDAGAVHVSSSSPSERIWFTTEGYEDPASGRIEEKSFHLSGFSARETETLFSAVTNLVRLGHPDSLSYCWADEWGVFAEGLELDENGMVVAAVDASLVGMPAAAVYVERFGVQTDEASWQEGVDEEEFHVLGANDAVFFATLDRPVLVRRHGEEGMSYRFEPKAYLNFDSAPSP